LAGITPGSAVGERVGPGWGVDDGGGSSSACCTTFCGGDEVFELEQPDMVISATKAIAARRAGARQEAGPTPGKYKWR